jgi:ATP-dependent helicase/nuclease subunit A
MSTSGRPPADAAARSAAVTDFTRNLCVTSGAGCGKTSLLVERILFALLARGTPLERIVAITFTTKAAAQMRQRVTAALVDLQRALAAGATLAAAIEAATDEAKRTLERLRGHEAGRDLERLRRRIDAALAAEPNMTTIHSFALALLARHPIEADLPADAAMDIGDGFRRHAQAQLPALVERALATDGGGAVGRALARLTLGELSQLARSAAWLPEPIVARPDDPLAPLRPRLAQLQRELAAARAALPPSAAGSKLLPHWDLLDEALRRTLDAKPGAAPRHPPALDELLDKKLSTAQVKGLDERRLEEVRERLAEAQRLLKKLRRVDEPFAADAIAAARALGEELADSFARQGFLPADGALARAADLLAHDAALRRAESDAFELLLVDEFQDTDPLQCEIILRLCQERDAAASLPLEEVVLARGRLFLVGDPKQSIYRFRGADLEMFARARRFLLDQGGAELLLTANFRSRPAVIDAVNTLFQPFIGPANDFEPDYVALVAHREADRSVAAPVELWSVAPATPDAKARQRRTAEGKAIAREIAALHASGTGYGKVAILLRTLSVLPFYVQPLRDRAIPFVVAGGKSFVQRSEVGELASLLLAAADPDDPVACLGALRSTLFAVSDADLLAAVATADGTAPLHWPALVESPVESVARAARELARLHAIVRRAPAADAVEQLVEATLLLPLSAAARDGEQRVANLRKLAGQAVARAEETRLPLAEALRDLLATHEQVDGEAERSLADEEIDAVRILTIHKAKGLEYDVVFVGDLARSGDRRERSEVALRSFAAGGAPRAALAIATLDLVNAAEVARSERELRHQEAEGKRLLYVACTRARERLILVHSAKQNGHAPWIDPLGALGYAADGHAPADGPLASGVRHRAIAEPERQREPAAAGVAPFEELAEAAGRFARAAAAARAPPPRFERPSEAGATAAAAGDGASEGDPELARAVGIACHAALALSGPATPATDAQIDAAAARAAAATGAGDAAIASATRELLRAAPARALQRALAGVRVVAIELPVTLARDGRLWRGDADLLFLDGDELVVGDWKSDHASDPEELAERYRPQLAIYRDAIQSALRRAAPPRMELLHLRSGRRIAL